MSALPGQPSPERLVPIRVVPSGGAGAEWHEKLERRSGRIIGDERNVLLALRHAPELRGLFYFNEFALNVEFARAPIWRDVAVGTTWTDDDDLALQAWLQTEGVDVRQRGIVGDSVVAIAKESLRHPVREYLCALRWDGTPRLGSWLQAHLGATTEPAAYLAAVGTKFLLSAVARIMQPGCQADHVLVLEGDQGIGKSQSARILACNQAWFADDVPDVHTKDAAIQLCGKWIVELAELAAIRRASEIEAVKAFITRTQDVFRPPYGRRTVTVPRQSAFIATTNEREYLKDKTGNRRFWPVRCTRIDVDGLASVRDQLWAEAVHRYRHGEVWHLTDKQIELASEQQRERVLVTELEADVAEWLGYMAGQGHTQVTSKQVFIYALGLKEDDKGFTDACRRLGAEVAKAIQDAGWERVPGRQGRGAHRRTIYRLCQGDHQASPRSGDAA